MATNYGLRVSTPAASGSQGFSVLLSKDCADWRSARYPALKPLTFSVVGALTNSGGGAWHYFQVDVPTNQSTGWRLVLSSTNPVVPSLYVRRGQLPTLSAYDSSSVGAGLTTLAYTSNQVVAGTWFIGVYLPAGAANWTSYALGGETNYLTPLIWDSGATDRGTQVFTNASPLGGDYCFSITALSPTVGVWRTVLRVQSGEAELYLAQGTLPTTNAAYASKRVGSDGLLLAQAWQFSAGQTWFVLVHATPGAQWELVSGEAYVQPLPALAPDASSGAAATIGAEGMRFFKTTISPGTLAWRLALSGLTNPIYVRKTGAPHPYNSSTFDLSQSNQMLLVPSYLNVGDCYFVGVVGNPGAGFTLDSRQQSVADLAFGATTNLSVGDYGYVTFRVQVPVQPIAWQIAVTPSAGDANLAVASNSVPNEYVNTAFSDVAGTAGKSLTLVPPVLSDGTFYVTVYGTPPYAATLANGMPVISDVPYVFQVTNDAPAWLGWRYYRTANTDEQQNSLLWKLALSAQPAGTEIALRRNAVPGQWNQRNNPKTFSTSSQGYMDLSSISGVLQQPNHPADIWYIGVYSPTLPLGAFVLSATSVTPATIATLPVDGVGSTTNIFGQIPGLMQYFRFDVPAGILGWEVRLTNITSGDPRLVIARDQTPSDLTTHYASGAGWSAYADTNWPGGAQWAAYNDWTGYSYAANGTNELGHILAMGLGNPLQPGAYYVGVLNGAGSGATNLMNYSLLSRTIGPGRTIAVSDLDFTNGSITASVLPREAAYYRVTVPSNAPSWKLRLTASAGECLLVVQKEALPNVGAANVAPTSLSGGRKLQKTGHEQYVLLPAAGASNLVAGTYYLGVVGEGMHPANNASGTNASAYTLTSFGGLDVINLGSLDNTGATDLSRDDNNQGGEVKAFQFTVPAATFAFEVHLENRTGNPGMTLRADGRLCTPYDSYGCNGGQSYAWYDTSLINLLNPVATNYTLMVQAAYLNGYPDAGYRIRVHARTLTSSSQPLDFDGGLGFVSAQAPGSWQNFQVTVPPDAVGWDVRLTNITSGDPRLVICRDQTASDLTSRLSNGAGWSASSDTAWPTGAQWGASGDWTGYTYGPDWTNEVGHILAMGMGNPLQPGTYYVGVYNGTGPGATNPMSYTVVSRGIGAGYAIPVMDLGFTNGTVSNPSLAAREVAYYRVNVPAALPGWRLRLGADAGDSVLMLQKGALPNIQAGSRSPVSLYGGRKLQKAGNEQYLLLPTAGQTAIAAGIYYVGVAGEGLNPSSSSSRAGTNASAFTLTSYGSVTVSNLGTVTGVDLVSTNSQEGGECRAFQFSVPNGVLSLQARLESRLGNPYMTLQAGTPLPSGYDAYGLDGGQNYSWSDPAVITLPNPASTNYTLLVQAISSGGDASYRLRLHALGSQLLTFDGGVASVTAQSVGLWQYFFLTVPPDALGWDLRLTNVTSGDPRLVICRDQAPTDLNTHLAGGVGWSPYSDTNWSSGAQWGARSDWTGYSYGPDGTNELGHLLAMGMGNPLQPGTYYIGINNGTASGYQNPMSYTLVSRGIGPGYAIPVADLAFTNGVVSNPALLTREAAYYRVFVPSNVPNWKIRLSASVGESLLALQKGALPNVQAAGSSPLTLNGGRKLQKTSHEQYLLLPSSGSAPLPSGAYYLLAASEGVNPTTWNAGSNASQSTLASFGAVGVTNLGTVGVVDLRATNALQGGESSLYQFTVPASTAAIEVRLDNRVGNPYMTLVASPSAPKPYNNFSYGYDGGLNPTWSLTSLLTLANPAATNYTLTVNAADVNGGFPDASATLTIRRLPVSVLNFDADLNTNGLTHTASGALSDAQSAFYQVNVPAFDNGLPVVGWKLGLTQSTGTPKLRVRPGLVPDDAVSTPFANTEALIVPPYLTPGLWYVEVRGVGSSSYVLTSAALRPEQPAWLMPAVGGSVTTPGLPAAGPLFGDSGVDSNGVVKPGDQGTDLEMGRFHLYALTVPPDNVGVLRTRLDAISGNPNLFVRTGAPPTLVHSASGGSGTLYDRALTAVAGSQYGNWVPLNGRYEPCLTPGTWFLAVRAAGSSNVRYRLRLFTGFINELALNGGSYSAQHLNAGDWLYYRIQVPPLAPTVLNVTFSQDLGDVVMYVRDRVPPGQGFSVTDCRDWSTDAKNHGPYPSYDPAGTYALTTPPLRPGNTYYLGFRAVSDATFSVSCNTNGATMDYTNSVLFYAGFTNTIVPAFGVVKLRVEVPAEARRLLLDFSNSAAFNLYLDQGSVPTATSSDHWTRLGGLNPSLNQPLYGTGNWPYVPNCTYFLLASNTSATALPFALAVDGRNCATDDYDGDGLPDCWELTYWSSIYNYAPSNDPDGDGVSNLDEFLEGTDPTNPLSFHPRLNVAVQGGLVDFSPAGTLTTNVPPKRWYTLGQTVRLTATANPGSTFLGWIGDASGLANPLTLTMDTNKNLTAVFGYTNQPNADYRFQNHLHSSVGTAPDLTDIGVGNAFIAETVDGTTQTVYRFLPANGVSLTNVSGVIPTNVYTVVLLFRFDAVSGWRRILESKTPSGDYGLYDCSGALYFYPWASGTYGVIQPSNYVQVVITRDSSNVVVGYVNGAQQFSYVDSARAATVSGTSLALRFFKDDGSDNGSGAIARIRLFEVPLPPAQVAALDRLAPPAAPPRFGLPCFDLHGLVLSAAAARWVLYRLQTSTNLVNWETLSTNTPNTDSLLLSDPAWLSYPARFYRLVSP